MQNVDYDVIDKLKNAQGKKFLEQGWATSLIGGPYDGRRSLSRAGLLDGSSSISSTTTIVRIALIGRANKVYTSSDVLLFTENIGETVT